VFKFQFELNLRGRMIFRCPDRHNGEVCLLFAGFNDVGIVRKDDSLFIFKSGSEKMDILQ